MWKGYQKSVQEPQQYEIFAFTSFVPPLESMHPKISHISVSLFSEVSEPRKRI